MPKIVDHEERRAEIAAAMWRVIARDGMGAASARSIAAEAGWSLGAVRHYFSSQAQLHHFAAEEMAQRVATRVFEIIGTQPPGAARCQAMLEQLLPLDKQRLGEVRAWLALLVHAQTDPSMDEIRLQAYDGERRICRFVVLELSGTGPRDTPQPLPAPLEAEAARLHALIDGLTVQACTTPERLSTADLQQSVTALVADVESRLPAVSTDTSSTT